VKSPAFGRIFLFYERRKFIFVSKVK